MAQLRPAELKLVYATLLLLLEMQRNTGAMEPQLQDDEDARSLELCTTTNTLRLGSVFGNFSRHHKKGHRRRTTTTEATTSDLPISTAAVVDDDFVTSHYSTISPLDIDATYTKLPQPSRLSLDVDTDVQIYTDKRRRDRRHLDDRKRKYDYSDELKGDIDEERIDYVDEMRERIDDVNNDNRLGDKEVVREFDDISISKSMSKVKKIYRERSSGVNKVSKTGKGGIFLTDNCTMVIAQIGTTAILHCEVSDITENTVTWIRRKDYSLLSVGLVTYSADSRFFSAHGRHVKDWALHVRFVTGADSGYYECQVPTHPPTSIFFKLVLVAAFAEIAGESEKIIHEGSMLRLVCVVRKSTEPPSYVFWYFENRMINYDLNGVSVSNGRQTSELVITRAEPRHAGNYTCVPANARPASVTVHVIQSETPAAMQHGNSSGAAARRRHIAITSAASALILAFVHSSTYSLYVCNK